MSVKKKWEVIVRRVTCTLGWWLPNLAILRACRHLNLGHVWESVQDGATVLQWIYAYPKNQFRQPPIFSLLLTLRMLQESQFQIAVCYGICPLILAYAREEKKFTLGVSNGVSRWKFSAWPQCPACPVKSHGVASCHILAKARPRHFFNVVLNTHPSSYVLTHHA